MNYAKKPKICSAGGSVENDWYIELYVPEPDNPGHFKRIKKYCDINRETTCTARMKRAKHHLKNFEILLNQGWTPLKRQPHPSLKAETEVKRWTLKECVDQYLPYTKSVLARPTYLKYKFYLKSFLSWSNSPTYIDEVRKQHILDFLSYKQDKWGNKMCNNFKIDFSTFLNYWVVNFEGILDKNYISKMSKLPEEVEGNTAYNDNQIERLKELMIGKDPYMYFICQIVYNTCTRPQAETRQLKCGDIDFQQKRLVVGSRIAKTNSRGFVPLSDTFLDILRTQGIDTAPREWYILTAQHKPGPKPIAGKTMAKWYREFKKEAGLDSRKYSLYGWKHTRNIHAWMDTKDVMFIKTLNRHKSLEMTMKYLKDLGCFVDNNSMVNKVRSL